MNVWVLTKTVISRQLGEEDSTKILGVYKEWDDLLGRLSRIRQANKQYDMAELSPYHWRLGPDEDEDEGFFGNQPIYLRAEVTEYFG